jgi:DNA-binding transcriptional MerR regulator
METLSIGQLAKAAGVHVETVRYYERRGLLAEPPRTAAGYRQYGEADVWRLEFIGRAKRLGFTLAEIADVLGEGRDRSSERVVGAARAKVEVIDAQMRDLADTRTRLEQLVGICEDGNIANCVALDWAR